MRTIAEPRPGDTVVVTVSPALVEIQVGRVVEELQRHFAAGVRVLLLPEGATVAGVLMAETEEGGMMHACSWPHCQEMVPGPQWGCLAHWRRLPEEVRERVMNLARSGDGPGLAALNAEIAESAEEGAY